MGKFLESSGVAGGQFGYRPRISQKAAKFAPVPELQAPRRSETGKFLESEALKARFVHSHPLCRQKIVILPPPVDTVRFRPSKLLREAIRKELGIPEAMKVILGVGRLDSNKSYATLVEAMGLLKRQDCIVMIAGQGREELRLKQTALRVGVLDRLRLIGVRGDIEAVYAGADIFAHPSVLESYAYVVLEAMSVGLPCIVSRASTVGISGDLTDGSNALLADPHDPQDWANQISRLLAQPDYSADISRRARRFCELRPGLPARARRMLSELGIHHDVNSTHHLA